MFSFINRVDAVLFKRVLMVGLTGAVVAGMLAPANVEARDARRPYIIPGDADGPAGVQDAVAIRDRGNDGVVLACLQLGPWTCGLVAIHVDSGGRVTWIAPVSSRARALEDPKR